MSEGSWAGDPQSIGGRQPLGWDCTERRAEVQAEDEEESRGIDVF